MLSLMLTRLPATFALAIALVTRFRAEIDTLVAYVAYYGKVKDVAFAKMESIDGGVRSRTHVAPRTLKTDELTPTM